MLTFFAGLERTGPSTAAILSTFEPVVTAALAALVLGESLSPVQLAGGALVLCSAAVLQLRRADAGHRIGTRPRLPGQAARGALPGDGGGPQRVWPVGDEPDASSTTARAETGRPGH
ncbi:DMT family transporter [Plantactinospora siamensis]|uniref:DMT family transporter n=1 Tax=Plantactinospora siamensis TaxID=555372 RepID=A0ABV6P5M7_9ACTN